MLDYACGNGLASWALGSPDMANFDAVVTCMALHHFEHPRETAAAGGAIAITDWAPTMKGGALDEAVKEHESRKEKHAAHGTINKEFLSPENVLGMFEEAGCDMSTAYYIVVGEKSHIPEEIAKVPGGLHPTMFLALAKRKL
ncbi:unnamed protein product [Parascedosporium putredinis]|uniref:Uncharacterized protein n=1 Tax=Parascedosporium putredinis TaxID=1442378 RepID=A0A9P1H1E2_9PEZI|nr:unnamed protein product [Parascedosporium putredinis]CAI7992629.1 unnamed protein product [Parascedosporium putredinis]